MSRTRITLVCTIFLGCLYQTALGQTALSPTAPAQSSAPAVLDQATVQKLLDRLSADEARIKELESKLNPQGSPATSQPVATTVAPAIAQNTVSAKDPAAPPVQTASATPVPDASSGDSMGMDMGGGHAMELPGGGPNLKVRGYLDLNFGVGGDANPLIFPMGVPAHSAFQAGELALMASSQLSDKLSFMSEVVIGSDPTNEFGVDVERYLLDYKASKYFEAGVGRFHTAIGYYSTAFHHGTWYQTATGRPFMYFFEDSGGVLPVHSVGTTFTGLVPGTDKLGLHWIAEVSNGRSSSNTVAPVQNFYADRNHKAVNFAAYISPEAIRGLQIGGSYYLDRLAPPGIAAVDQRIGSLYGVYITPTWEFMNEAVLLSNHLENGRTFNTPLAYTQLARKFGAWHPYLRYQYVNSPQSDPVNIFTGVYSGPSLGLRYEFSDYAAFKLQYNRLYQGALPTLNGLDAQIAFTF